MRVDDGRLLLVRLAQGPADRPRPWTLPGGGLDHGEDPADGALRELDEETGFRGRILRLLGIHSWLAPWRPEPGIEVDLHVVRIVYEVEVVGARCATRSTARPTGPSGSGSTGSSTSTRSTWSTSACGSWPTPSRTPALDARPRVELRVLIAPIGARSTQHSGRGGPGRPGPLISRSRSAR
ncbi:MAG: NUDIX hydrolase [Acidimicrobiales bacterium]